jgi:hypothetical protein
MRFGWLIFGRRSAAKETDCQPLESPSWSSSSGCLAEQVCETVREYAHSHTWLAVNRLRLLLGRATAGR